MAPAVLHNHFKGNVKPEIEKNWPNKDKMAHGAEAHKKSSKEMCDANSILQRLQRTSKGLCLRRH